MKLLITSLVLVFFISYVMGEGKPDKVAAITDLHKNAMQKFDHECKNWFEKIRGIMQVNNSDWEDNLTLLKKKFALSKDNFVEELGAWKKMAMMKMIAQYGNQMAVLAISNQYKAKMNKIADDWRERMAAKWEKVRKNPHEWIAKFKNKKRFPKLEDAKAEEKFQKMAKKMHSQLEQAKRLIENAGEQMKKTFVNRAINAKNDKLLSNTMAVIAGMKKHMNNFNDLEKQKQEYLKDWWKKLKHDKPIDEKDWKDKMEEFKKKLHKAVEDNKNRIEEAKTKLNYIFKGSGHGLCPCPKISI